MNEQSFEHVLVSAHVRPPKSTGLVEMRTRSLEQFRTSAEEAFPTIPADAPSIRVDRGFRLPIATTQSVVPFDSLPP